MIIIAQIKVQIMVIICIDVDFGKLNFGNFNLTQLTKNMASITVPMDGWGF